MGLSKRQTRVKAVLFDLGGTLIYTTEIPQVYRKILEVHGFKRSIEEISHAQQETERNLDIQNLAVLFEEYWIRWNMQILRRLGIKENMRGLAETIAERWWDYSKVELYPEVVETLQQLRSMGLKIGIVTNGLKSDYKEILRKVGLLDSFDVMVGVDTVGKMKPQKEIFLYALDKLEVSPSEAVFVGDQVRQDYEGARRAGLRPLLIDRNNLMSGDVESVGSLGEVKNYLT